jgi:tRNA A37 N6-isopentenylltransferase MiaA
MIEGRRGGEGVVEKIQRDTRRFAKRQMTWFRGMDLDWVDPTAPLEVVSRVKYLLQRRGSPLS